MLPIETLVASTLKSAGYKKKARTWWRTTPDSIQVVNLQKSPYGEQVYVNLGLYVRALGNEEFPPENRCHIRARLERVVPAEFHELVVAANSVSQPAEGFVQALATGLAWLEGIASPTGRRSFLAAPAASRCFINALVRSA
jgi:hypothetical protein